MVEDYEAFERRFRAEFQDRVNKRTMDLDLDDLPPGSSLETCFLLVRGESEGRQVVG